MFMRAQPPCRYIRYGPVVSHDSAAGGAYQHRAGALLHITDAR